MGGTGANGLILSYNMYTRLIKRTLNIGNFMCLSREPKSGFEHPGML